MNETFRRNDPTSVEFSLGKDKVTAIKFEGGEKGAPTVCFLPGYGLPASDFSASLSEIARSTGDIFGITELPNVDLPPIAQEWVKSGAIKESVARKAASFASFVSENRKILKAPVDVLGHSAGALYAALAKVLAPELFGKVILHAPAGFMENDTERRLISAARTRLISSTGGEVMKANFRGKGAHANSFGMRSLTSSGARMLVQPFGEYGRMFAEVKDLAGSFAAPLVSELFRNGAVNVRVILPEHDVLFPLAQMKKTMERYGIPYEMYKSGEHLSLGFDKDAAAHVARILSRK